MQVPRESLSSAGIREWSGEWRLVYTQRPLTPSLPTAVPAPAQPKPARTRSSNESGEPAVRPIPPPFLSHFTSFALLLALLTAFATCSPRKTTTGCCWTGATARPSPATTSDPGEPARSCTWTRVPQAPRALRALPAPCPRPGPSACSRWPWLPPPTPSAASAKAAPAPAAPDPPRLRAGQATAPSAAAHEGGGAAGPSLTRGGGAESR